MWVAVLKRIENHRRRGIDPFARRNEKTDTSSIWADIGYGNTMYFLGYLFTSSRRFPTVIRARNIVRVFERLSKVLRKT